MRTYLIAIAVLATALVVFMGLVQPPPVIEQASDAAASVDASNLAKENNLLVGDPENTRR